MIRLVILASEARVKVVLVPLTDTCALPISCLDAVLSVKVWPLVPRLKITFPAPLVQVEPTAKVRLLLRVSDEALPTKAPLVPPPIVVVPVIASVKAPWVKVQPSPTVTVPVTARLAPVVRAAVPVMLTFPPTVVMTVVAVAEPLMLKSVFTVVTPVTVLALVPLKVKVL